MFNNVFNGLKEQAERTNPITTGDYYQDGLLYCGKCHTPKQAMIRQPRVKGFEQGYKPMPIICECRAKQLEEERRAQEAYQRKLYRYHALGKIGATQTFEVDDRADDYASKVCRGYAAAFREISTGEVRRTPADGLLLCGNTGTGKTFLCHAILNAVADKGYTIMAVTVGQFERKLWSGDKAEIFSRIETTDLILLDDLGAERASQYTQQIVYDLLDTRVSVRKPLLITTNLTREQIFNPESTESRRILSRVHGAVSIVPLRGRDRRTRDFAENSKRRVQSYYNAGANENAGLTDDDGVMF